MTNIRRHLEAGLRIKQIIPAKELIGADLVKVLHDAIDADDDGTLQPVIHAEVFCEKDVAGEVIAHLPFKSGVNVRIAGFRYARRVIKRVNAHNIACGLGNADPRGQGEIVKELMDDLRENRQMALIAQGVIVVIINIEISVDIGRAGDRRSGQTDKWAPAILEILPDQLDLRRVAELVGQGRRNRDMAFRLAFRGLFAELTGKHKPAGEVAVIGQNLIDIKTAAGLAEAVAHQH